MSALATLARVLADVDVAANPYFGALRNGSFERADFVETQVQFYYAVVFFSRPMAVAAAKIPSAGLRVEIMRNVWEEHGEGDAAAMHGATFLQMLERLGGLSLADVESRSLWPELRAFNTLLIGCATADDWEVSTACLGTIERMFADISAWIGNAIVERGWLPADELVHYKLHTELDVRHAADFFDVLERAGDGSERHEYLVEQGARLGAYAFDALYAGLFRARERRQTSPIRRAQPHVYRG